MKKYVFIALSLILVNSAQGDQATPNKSQDQEEAAAIEEDVRPEKFITEFMNEVLINRELVTAAKYFSTIDEYIVLNRSISIPDAWLKLNHAHDKDMFMDDCDKILDMMPKVNSNQIRIIKIEKLGVPSSSNLKNCLCYKAVFTYDEGVSRAEIHFPEICHTKSGFKFASRFRDPLRFTR